MPTIPPDQAGRPAGEPHRHRQMAESFGVDPGRYDRTRPRYPRALIDAIVTASPGPGLLDVGIGTGIAARQLRAAGCRVLGVEADERMAAVARRDGFDVEIARFEDWDPAGRAFDAVTAGQAWHWIDPAAGAARAGQALRPGGLFAAFWNVFEVPPELAAALAGIYRRMLPDAPAGFAGSAVGGYRRLIGKHADALRAGGQFGEPAELRFDWDQPYTTAQWLDMLPTQGLHTRLPPDTLAELSAAVGAAIDAAGGRFTAHYVTLALTAARRDG